MGRRRQCRWPRWDDDDDEFGAGAEMEDEAGGEAQFLPILAAGLKLLPSIIGSFGGGKGAELAEGEDEERFIGQLLKRFLGDAEYEVEVPLSAAQPNRVRTAQPPIASLPARARPSVALSTTTCTVHGNFGRSWFGVSEYRMPRAEARRRLGVRLALARICLLNPAWHSDGRTRTGSGIKPARRAYLVRTCTWEETTMAGENHDNGNGGGAAERFRGISAVIVAIALLLGFAALLIYLVGKAGTAADGTWSRYVYLLGAMEALVFTAVGWLFGREVNRQAVQSAEARADQAIDRTEGATAMAAEQEANGRALRAAVETRVARPGMPGVEERGIGGGGPGGGEQMRALADLARALFPDK